VSADLAREAALVCRKVERRVEHGVVARVYGRRGDARQLGLRRPAVVGEGEELRVNGRIGRADDVVVRVVGKARRAVADADEVVPLRGECAVEVGPLGDVLPATMLLLTFTAPTLLTMPPPPLTAELLLTVLFMTFAAPFWLAMPPPPPPLPLAELLLTVLFVTFAVPLKIKMPPPSPAELLLTVLPVTVNVPLLRMPPPFPLMTDPLVMVIPDRLTVPLLMVKTDPDCVPSTMV
jgi:hypothetical protein